MTALLKALSWLSAIPGVGALLIVTMLLIRLLSDGAESLGMALVGLGFWAILLTVVSLIAGFVAYFIASGKQLALPMAGKIGLVAAGTTGTIIALALFLD